MTGGFVEVVASSFAVVALASVPSELPSRSPPFVSFVHSSLDRPSELPTA